MEHENNQNRCPPRPPNSGLSHAGTGARGFGPTLVEALAPCLADLKRQLELRQAMH